MYALQKLETNPVSLHFIVSLLRSGAYSTTRNSEASNHTNNVVIPLYTIRGIWLGTNYNTVTN